MTSGWRVTLDLLRGISIKPSRSQLCGDCVHIFGPDTPQLIIFVEQRQTDSVDSITIKPQPAQKQIAISNSSPIKQTVFSQPAKMAEEVQQKFETLQLHAGYDRIGSTM